MSIYKINLNFTNPKNMITRIGSYFVVFVLLFVNNTCIFHEKNYQLILKDSVVFYINKPIPEFCVAMFYYEKGKQKFLFVDDRQNHEIRVINMNTNKEIDPIPLPDTGIISIPYHFGFVIKNLDSIYIPGSNYYLYCIDQQGNINKRIDFSELSIKYPLLTPICSISRFSKGAIILGNEIYFLQNDSRKFYTSSYKPSDYHFLLRYDTKTDSIGISPISIPDAYWNNGEKQMSIMMTYNTLKKRFVFGTMYDDFIIESKDGKRITKTYHSKSKSIKDFFSYNPKDNLNSEDYFYTLCKSSHNAGLFWDPHKMIYYRFVWPGVEDLKVDQHERISEMLNCFPTFTVEILDQNFITIGSYKLPEHKYNLNNYFLTEKGLYLARNQSLKDERNLKWTFHLFKVIDHNEN